MPKRLVQLEIIKTNYADVGGVCLVCDLVAEYQIFQQKHLKFFQVSTETKGGGIFKPTLSFIKAILTSFLLYHSWDSKF